MFGVYTFTRFYYTAGTTPLYTEFRVFDKMVVFELNFPLGANNTWLGDAIKDVDRLATAFPRWGRSSGRLKELGHFCFLDQWELLMVRFL